MRLMVGKIVGLVKLAGDRDGRLDGLTDGDIDDMLVGKIVGVVV